MATGLTVPRSMACLTTSYRRCMWQPIAWPWLAFAHCRVAWRFEPSRPMCGVPAGARISARTKSKVTCYVVSGQTVPVASASLAGGRPFGPCRPVGNVGSVKMRCRRTCQALNRQENICIDATDWGNSRWLANEVACGKTTGIAHETGRLRLTVLDVDKDY